MNKLYKDVVFVGLTGQSGAGKTTVGEYFADCNYGVINCDVVSRKVTSDGSDCLDDLRLEFSNIILNEDGTLNRKTLANIVFSDNSKLLRLNEIIFPYILDKIQSAAEALIKNGFKVIVLDAPTLFESGLDKTCDIIISVVCDQNVRLDRIILRDNISKNEASARMSSQLDEDYFKTQSDLLIDNDSDVKALSTQLKSVRSYIDCYKKVV